MGRKLTLLLLGILIGMVIMHFLQAKRVDEYYWQKEEIKVELYETTERLKRIEEQHERLLPNLVEEVRLEITMQDNAFVDPSLRRLIYDLAKELIGYELQALPYPLVYNILDNRILEIEKKKYRLKVEAVIIAETVTYYLTVEKLQEETVALTNHQGHGLAPAIPTATSFATCLAGRQKLQAAPTQSRQ